MCASANFCNVSSLLLVALLTNSIISPMLARTSVEGLPLFLHPTEDRPENRQELGSTTYQDKGVLSGADFLSVFASTSSFDQLNLPVDLMTTDETPETTLSYARAIRSTSFTTNTNNPNTATTPMIAQQSSDLNSPKTSSRLDLDEGVVLEVHVSSSVGSMIHKEPSVEDTGTQLPVPSEEQPPSIVLGANKSEFNVEEGEPIMSSSAGGDPSGYPASVQPLPRTQFHSGDFLSQLIVPGKIKPVEQKKGGDDYHHHHHETLIYHNEDNEPPRARSVSYSTVIRGASHPSPEWHDEDSNSSPKHERRERNYDSSRSQVLNNFQWNHRYDDNNKNKTRIDDRIDRVTPTIYGRPEQNYEIDESASVMTNGRLHGVQFTPPPSPSKKPEEGGVAPPDDKKVGYVVEGRNYRKYRVEERTSDGFIVGEYGVVSHDDGSLRGVRYTADGTISPRLIYDALMKFLSL